MPVYHGGKLHKGKAFSDKKQRKRHDITCSKCGKKWKVLYKPNPETPQFCKPCYIRL